MLRTFSYMHITVGYIELGLHKGTDYWAGRVYIIRNTVGCITRLGVSGIKQLLVGLAILTSK